MDKEKLLKPTLVSIQIRSDLKEKMPDRRVEPLRPRNHCRLSNSRLIDTVSPNDADNPLAPLSSSVDFSSSGDKTTSSRTGQFTKVLTDRRRKTTRSQSDGNAATDSKQQTNGAVLTQSLQQASVWFGQQRIYQTSYNPFDYSSGATSSTSHFNLTHTRRSHPHSDLINNSPYLCDDLPVSTNNVFPMSKSLPKAPSNNNSQSQSGLLCTTLSMTNGNTPMATTKRLLVRSQPNATNSSTPPSLAAKCSNSTSSESAQSLFPDPMIGAPPVIVTKVNLLQSLEADTIRWEKAKAFKKRLKAIKEQQC